MTTWTMLGDLTLWDMSCHRSPNTARPQRREVVSRARPTGARTGMVAPGAGGGGNGVRTSGRGGVIPQDGSVLEMPSPRPTPPQRTAGGRREERAAPSGAARELLGGSSGRVQAQRTEPRPRPAWLPGPRLRGSQGTCLAPREEQMGVWAVRGDQPRGTRLPASPPPGSGPSGAPVPALVWGESLQQAPRAPAPPPALGSCSGTSGPAK